MGFSFEVATLSDLADRLAGEGRTSLAIDSLQLEAGVGTGELLYAWGYCPTSAWTPLSLKPSPSKKGKVFVEVDPPLEEAISVSISRSVVWSYGFDRESGWVCIFLSLSPLESLIEIAEGVLIGLIGENINSVWLRPDFNP
jgi:hypothetical protein